MSSASSGLTKTIDDIESYLDAYGRKELLRFVTVGSVDDGKSTLIGRLLHDSGMVYEDQLDAARKATTLEGEEIDFSLLTDGLKAEREQGITIDVAYRYFTTDRRKFIIADTPGHVQYTRNMATGASTADVALILIDARLGVLEQSRRHGYLAALLGIPHLAVCINKMDLVAYDQQAFHTIAQEFRAFTSELGFSSVTFFPVSALKGVNIVRKSETTPWYEGDPVLEYLETVPLVDTQTVSGFRLPVQYVLRPNLNYRGFAGTLTAGTVSVGDAVVALPSGRKSQITHIDTYDGPLDTAKAPQAVVLRLADEIDISRGDMLAPPGALPNINRHLTADLVWMHETPLDTEKTYILKHTTQSVRTEITRIVSKKDLLTLTDTESHTLCLNDIGQVQLACHRAVFFDSYRQSRATGAFILIDSLTNTTVAAGMLRSAEERQRPHTLESSIDELMAGSAIEPKTQVSPTERYDRMHQRGCVVWLTGLPGSGRWPLAYALERRLFDEGSIATVINPIDENLTSMISAAKACSDAGLIAICAFASFQTQDRVEVQGRVGDERFVHVYVNTNPDLCRRRRPDASFEGFEPPATPDVRVALDELRLSKAVECLVETLQRRGVLDAARRA